MSEDAVQGHSRGESVLERFQKHAMARGMKVGSNLYGDSDAGYVEGTDSFYVWKEELFPGEDWEKSGQTSGERVAQMQSAGAAWVKALRTWFGGEETPDSVDYEPRMVTFGGARATTVWPWSDEKLELSVILQKTRPDAHLHAMARMRNPNVGHWEVPEGNLSYDKKSLDPAVIGPVDCCVARRHPLSSENLRYRQDVAKSYAMCVAGRDAEKYISHMDNAPWRVAVCASSDWLDHRGGKFKFSVDVDSPEAALEAASCLVDMFESWCACPVLPSSARPGGDLPDWASSSAMRSMIEDIGNKVHAWNSTAQGSVSEALAEYLDDGAMGAAAANAIHGSAFYHPRWNEAAEQHFRIPSGIMKRLTATQAVALSYLLNPWLHLEGRSEAGSSREASMRALRQSLWNATDPRSQVAESDVAKRGDLLLGLGVR